LTATDTVHLREVERSLLASRARDSSVANGYGVTAYDSR
jgi:hypothetical protein